LLGFLHLSEVMVPVIRLHRLWQFPETPLGLWTPLIVVNEGERRMALLVERVDQVVNVDGDDVLPVPVDHVLNECVEGMFRSPTGPVLILAPQRLLLQQEAEMIAELQEQLRQRLGEPAGAPT
jgi:purine-binding chemotaxis protein CheW